MTQTQEPKYEIRDGKIVNRSSGEAIPDDEPIMIFRARDKHAHGAIMDYFRRCSNTQHAEVVLARAAQFAEFADDHPDRMKEPDTAPLG
jgi:hypothetical protein